MKARLLCTIIIVLILSACEDLRTTTQAPITTAASTLLPTKTPIPGPKNIIPTRIPTYTPRPTLNPLDIAKTVLTELSIDETHDPSPNGYCEWKRIIASSSGEISDKYNNQFFTYVTVTCANKEEL